MADIAAGNFGAAVRAAAQHGVLPIGRRSSIPDAADADNAEGQVGAACDTSASHGSGDGVHGGSSGSSIGPSGSSGDLAAYMRTAQGCAAACSSKGNPPGAAADAPRLVAALAAAAASLLLFLQANLTGCVNHCQRHGRHGNLAWRL